MSNNVFFASVGKTAAEKAALVWSCADDLYGAFKPSEYGLVIIPLTIIKRFDDCLKPTHDKVQETWEKVKGLEVKDGFLRAASGYPFYNTSKFTFDTLLADADNIESNFRDYCNGFSDNVADILARMNWDAMIDRLSDPDAPRLYQVLSNFKSEKADFNPSKVSAVDMGYVFEHIIRKFSEQDDAGQHFTSRDIIYLMVDLMIAADPSVFEEERIQKTVWDQAMGTSQMIDCAVERLTAIDADAKVTGFGQELNPFTFGIAKANALIRGRDAENMRFGDSLAKDQFQGYKFKWAISNPPFGTPYAEAEIKAEHAKGASGRFPTELPKQGDGQTLFMLNGLAHLDDDGVMAIIQDASPLYNDKPGRGVDDIRRYVLENDWLDAIVRLPISAFYNTGISTYIWLFSKDKRPEHKDKVLLIDASQCFAKRRKAMGDKKHDITDECRKLILQAYGEYRDGVYSAKLADGAFATCEAKLFSTSDFGFNRVKVYTPERDEAGSIIFRKGKPVAKKGKEYIDTEDIPLDEDIDSYISREVERYNPGAFAGTGATDVATGYQIPFTKTFYKYKESASSEAIAQKVIAHHEEVGSKLLDVLLGKAIQADSLVLSGVSWLQEIPKEWNMEKFGSLFRKRSEKVSDSDFPALSVTMQGVVPQLEHVVKSEDRSNRKLVIKGDFAINSRSDRRNACGFCDRDGSVSTITTVAIPRRPINIGYFGQLFATEQFADEFYSNGHGIVDDLWTTGWDEMKRIDLPIPPEDEQETIAKTLEQVDELISAQSQILEELKKYKKALAYELTTGKKRVDVD